MSLYAAIGYVIGIFIFAIIVRFTRWRMIQRYMARATAERFQAEKDK